ncbi:MAG: hypothetical protein H7641_05685 [Candidatus Heimdallarchaeota archaeon]|nr:hypothetical protein [Candidatus Heimdallarchaeota archaeon]MCK4877052.1 hypothetical protein [Candidatus Heimdallarchaeota archaeon]
MEEKDPIVTKKMLAFALTAPFLFSVGGMIIALFSTQNSPPKIRNIALIVATFLGLFVAIGSIFLIQMRINKKISKQQKES